MTVRARPRARSWRGASRDESRLLEQRAGARLAAAKLAKDIHRMTAAAEREDRAAKSTTGVEHRVRIVEPFFTERREGVGAQHLCPFVAVVASRVTTRKNVRKTAEK